jgi:hypothetical protein
MQLAPVTVSHVDIVFARPERGGSLREVAGVVGACVVRTQRDGIGVEWDELAPRAVADMLVRAGDDDAVFRRKHRAVISERI